MPDDIVTPALSRANASAAEMRKPVETKDAKLRRILAEIFELCEQALNNSQSLAEAADVMRLIERKVEEAERC